MGLVVLWHVGLPGPGIEPLFPALSGGFPDTGSPGKSPKLPFLRIIVNNIVNV